MIKKHLLRNLSLLILFLAGIGGGLYFFLFPPVIEVVRPVRGPAVYAVYATGTVEATVMLPIAPRSSARITELRADEGSHVKKGELLAQLEDKDLQRNIDYLEARARYAKNSYERNMMLVKKHFISQEVFEHAKADWLSASAELEKAKIQADYMEISAPADGYIISRDGEIGQFIPVNQPIFWLSCCAPLRISTEVDEEDIAQVKPGQKVVIHADAFPEKIFHGKVEAITPKGNPIARSYRVRVSFTEEVPLHIGMTAETNIIIREHANALLLPVTAVADNKVWLVKNNHLLQQTVTIGAKGADKIEITQGISDDDIVVLNPDNKLKSGDKIRPTFNHPNT